MNRPLRALALLFALAPIALASCAKHHDGTTPAVGTAKIRFIHGSADSGPVDVFVDGNSIATQVTYGSVATLATVTAASHTLTIYPAGSDTGNPLVPSITATLSSNTHYSFGIVGENAPATPTGSVALTNTLNAYLTTETLYNTTPGSAAANVHLYSPYVADLSPTGVNFGVSGGGTQTQLGSTVTIPGDTTGPITLPASATGVSIQFYGPTSPSIPTISPVQIDSTNTANKMPNGATDINATLYMIDGPAASTTPQVPPTLPVGFLGNTTAGFVGVFEPNGF